MGRANREISTVNLKMGVMHLKTKTRCKSKVITYLMGSSQKEQGGKGRGGTDRPGGVVIFGSQYE